MTRPKIQRWEGGKKEEGKKLRRQEGTLNIPSYCSLSTGSLYNRFPLLLTVRGPLSDLLIVVISSYVKLYLRGISTIVLLVLMPIEQISYHRPSKHKLAPASHIPLFSIPSPPKVVRPTRCVSGADQAKGIPHLRMLPYKRTT